ncbi:MAG: hypothetical protein WEA80_12620 [Gemmatimonadaceae bacterium]
MPTTRIRESDHQLLQGLAEKTGKQHQEIIHEALDAYERQRMLDEINAAYARLKANPKEWQHELDERRTWDSAVGDGIY